MLEQHNEGVHWEATMDYMRSCDGTVNESGIFEPLLQLAQTSRNSGWGARPVAVSFCWPIVQGSRIVLGVSQGCQSTSVIWNVCSNRPRAREGSDAMLKRLSAPIVPRAQLASLHGPPQACSDVVAGRRQEAGLGSHPVSHRAGLAGGAAGL